MRAHVYSIGEKTTDICVSQLIKHGFDVHCEINKKSWYDNYCNFIKTAYKEGVDCVRVDPDIIVNKNFTPENVTKEALDTPLMVQFKYYCLYSNGIRIGAPVFYRIEAIRIIHKHLKDLDQSRPETSASRIKDINNFLYTSQLIIGMHGFFQDSETIRRAYLNKISRKQDSEFDFDLVKKLISL